MGGDVQGKMGKTSRMKRPVKMDVHNYNMGPKDRELESQKTAGQMVGHFQDDLLTVDTCSTNPVTVEEHPKETPSRRGTSAIPGLSPHNNPAKYS